MAAKTSSGKEKSGRTEDAIFRGAREGEIDE